MKTVPDGDPVLGERIGKSLAFDGKVWLLGARYPYDDPAGGLVSLSLNSSARLVHFERGVIDIAKSGHALWSLRSMPEKRRFLAAEWRGNHFEDLRPLEMGDKELPVSLLVYEDSPLVLSTQSVYSIGKDGTWRRLALQGEIRNGSDVSAASPLQGGGVYVGFNIGEWGGGLQMVDVHSGVVSEVERRDTKAPCDGPLNRACDPVTSVIADPRNASCVLAAVGLGHMGWSHGRIIRVCGLEVTLVTERFINKVREAANVTHRPTEAFDGLAAAANGDFWGVTQRAVYLFDADGHGKNEYPLPQTFDMVSRIRLTRGLPGVLVLQSNLKWLEGPDEYTPILVPLE